MSGIVNMSRGATRPAVLLLVLVSLFAPNARAWEAECHFEGRACDGQRDEESALADWDGEHRTICLRTLDAADFPAELVTGELALPVPSDASGLPTTWTAAVTLRQRDRTLCEFAELPDFSYGLDDWSGVHSGDCPVPTHPSLACHNFFTMGAYNSTHFGAQAGAMYRHYHAVALGIAEDCAAIKARVVAAEEEWRAIEERRGESVPFEIRADDELKACEATAYAVEAVGQHYLTDNWSSGHMWQRWGGPTAETVGGHTNGLLVSIATGLLHGATFPGFEDDPMGAPHPDVHWVLPGRYEVPTPGVGDTYLDRVLEGDEYAVQRERLLGCAVDGFADVYNAGPKMWHESDAAAMAGLEGRSFDEARCLGPLVTNAAMEAGLTAEMVGLFGGHSSVPWRDLVRDPNQLAVIIRGFLGSYPGLADELDPHWDEFAESYARVAMDIEYRTFEDAQGYDAASGCQPAFMGVEPNDVYLDAVPPPYAEPPWPWPVEEAESGVPGRVRDLRRVFSAAFLETWCLTYGEPELLAMRTRCDAAGGEGDVCDICAEAMLRKLNFMDEGPDLPVCNFIESRENDAMFGGPFPCHRDSASCPYLDVANCIVASDADLIPCPTPEAYATNWCAGLVRIGAGFKITPEDCQPPE